MKMTDPANSNCRPLFRARAPWWGGDLQTIRNSLVADRGRFPGDRERLVFRTNDGTGDELLGDLHAPLGEASGPLIILIHGLTGCEDSTYIRESARFHLKRGRRVLRLNLRGAGPSRTLCQTFYHLGRARDLHLVISQLDLSIQDQGICPVGYSLGGNILANFLGTFKGVHNIGGAAIVSAPLQPVEAARRIMAPRNALYHRWLLKRMKADCLGLRATYTSEQLDALNDAQTIWDFDDRFIAPWNGFDGAEDYYRRTAGINVVNDIEEPTLFIHAEDDPWIPPGPYQEILLEKRSNFDVVLSTGGGHVGFHAQGSRETWHDRVIDRFVRTVFG